MYEIIEAAEEVDESGLPNQSYMPGEEQGGYPVGNQGNRTVFDADSHH